MRGAIEAGVDEEARLPAAQVRRVVVPEADVVHVLRVAEDPEELDCVRAPCRYIARELLHHQHRAFAAAEGDGIGDLGARIVDRRRDSLHRLVADQIADVRDDPRRAGLDELVVVKLIQVLGDNRRVAPESACRSDCSGPRDAFAVSSSNCACWSEESGGGSAFERLQLSGLRRLSAAAATARAARRGSGRPQAAD